MNFNLSYFIETLPLGFDLWNWTQRLDYYQTGLQGFSQLDDNIQNSVAEDQTSYSLKGVLEYMRSIIQRDPEKAAQNGWNVTYLALQFFVDPGLVTAPPPTKSPCDKVDNEQTKFIVYILPGAFFVLMLLSFLTTRKKLWTCCGRRPGIIYPIDFLNERSRRWAYAMVFAILSYRLLVLFEGGYFWKPDKFDDEEWMKTYAWTKVFVGIINIGILGLVYYPLMVCISLRRFLLANIVGLCYMVPWLYNHVHIWTVCPLDRDEMSLSAFFQSIFEAPILLCVGILLVAYVMDFSINAYTLCTRKEPFAIDDIKYPILRETQGKYRDSVAVSYVRALLKRKPLPPPASIGERIKRKLKYNVITGYRYSPRLICTMIVATMALYKIVIVAGIIVNEYASWGQDFIEDNKADFVDGNSTETYDLLHDMVLVVKYSFMACNIASAVVQVLTMLHIIVTHRANITKLYRGDRSWHFKGNSSPAATMVASMRYSGYQIAFLIYGYGILLAILFLVSVIVSYLIILPIINHTTSILFEIIKDFWPTVIVGLFIHFAQLLVAKFMFLQDNGRYMAIENRRLYHVVMFFLFFFNVILGLFSCLKRILFSMVFGVMLISRLDRCLLMRGFERFDTGFKAYLGMCVVDLYHTHPVLVSFVEILTEEVAKNPRPADEEKAVELSTTQRRRQRIRNKWWKCVTLANNPTIVIDLLHQEVKKRKHNGFGTTVVDQIGNVATGVIAGAAFSGSDAINGVTDDVTIF